MTQTTIDETIDEFNIEDIIKAKFEQLIERSNVQKETMQKDYDILESQYQKATAKIKELKKDNGASNQTNQLLTEKHQDLAIKYEALKQQHRELIDTYGSLHDGFEFLKETYENVEKQKILLQESNRALTDANKQLKTQTPDYTRLEQQIDKLIEDKFLVYEPKNRTF